MRTTIRNAFLSGTIFGLVIIICDLIGLLATLAVIFAELIYKNVTPQNTEWMFIALLVLLGLWAGIRGAQPTEPDTWSKAILGGLLAGLFAGIYIFFYALIIGTINARGIDMRTYLAQMSPEAINSFLFNQNTLTGAFYHLGLMLLCGLVGGITSRALGRGRIPRVYHMIRDRLESAYHRTALARWVAGFNYTQYVVVSVLLILAIFLPLTLNQYWNFTFGTVGIYVLMGLGINIVVGLAGLLDLGYVAFFAVGAYTVGLLTSPEKLPQFQMNFWVAALMGILFAALAGILLGLPVLRLRGDYLAIVTLGFGEIIRILIRSNLLADLTGGPQGVRDIQGPSLFGIDLTNDRAYMYMIVLAIILAIFVTIRLQGSRVGRAWMAMREDETVAQAMGINTYTHKLMAFAIGAAFAGLGGAIFASRNQFIGPEDANLLVSINVLAVVIVGGMGSIPGVFLGAFVLKGLPEILRQLQDYRILAFGGLLVFMMIVRPEGLWPSKRRRLEIKDEELPEGEIVDVHPEDSVTNLLDPSAEESSQ
jgi:ABC-type branched-subunit amino acid transport system permease subunit